MAITKARCLLLVNVIAYVLLVASGAVLINNAIDIGYEDTSGGKVGYYYHPASRAAASAFTNLFVTMAGVIGIAAALPGVRHLRSWSRGSLPAAAYPGFLAWLLTLLALGLSIKEVILGPNARDYFLGLLHVPKYAQGGKAGYLNLAVPRALLLVFLSVGQLWYLQTICRTGT